MPVRRSPLTLTSRPLPDRVAPRDELITAAVLVALAVTAPAQQLFDLLLGQSPLPSDTDDTRAVAASWSSRG